MHLLDRLGRDSMLPSKIIISDSPLYDSIVGKKSTKLADSPFSAAILFIFRYVRHDRSWWFLSVRDHRRWRISSGSSVLSHPWLRTALERKCSFATRVRIYAYGIHPSARQPQMALVTSSGPSRVATRARWSYTCHLRLSGTRMDAICIFSHDPPINFVFFAHSS